MVLMYQLYTHKKAISREALYMIGEANKNMVIILMTKQLIHNALASTECTQILLSNHKHQVIKELK